MLAFHLILFLAAFGGTGEVPDIRKIYDNKKRTSEKVGGTRTFKKTMLRVKNGTYENFGMHIRRFLRHS